MAQRIVIPIVAGIGNALLAVPMVRQLKRKLPDARIAVLARTDAMAEVFRRLEEVEQVIVTGKGLRGVMSMARTARHLRPDVFLVPFPSNRWQYSLLAAASGATRKVLHSYPVGYLRAMHFLPSCRVPAQRGLHDVQQNLNLFRAIGLEPDAAEPPVFRLTDADRARADQLLRDAGLPPHVRPIIVHAGSAQTVLAKAKRWPAASYAQLVQKLEQQFGPRIVLVEGPDEEGVAREIAPQGRTIRVIGPLGEAAALLERAELYIGSDSGLAHLAAAVGTRAITLFAPADPDRVSPFGYRHLVVQTPTPCSPCMQYPWHTPYPKILCREPYCVARISVEQVMAKVTAS